MGNVVIKMTYKNVTRGIKNRAKRQKRARVVVMRTWAKEARSAAKAAAPVKTGTLRRNIRYRVYGTRPVESAVIYVNRRGKGSAGHAHLLEYGFARRAKQNRFFTRTVRPRLEKLVGKLKRMPLL